MKLVLDGESLTLDTLYTASQTALDVNGNLSLGLSKGAKSNITRAADYVHQLATSGKTVYGINTGFGYFANTRIPTKDIAQLQENIIVSHACGVGEMLPRDLVLSLWIILLNSMCRGHRGLAPEKVEHILRVLETGMLANVPARGSVGASGDLAPTAHAVLALLGKGGCTLPNANTGKIESLDAGAVLKQLNFAPMKLTAKEGLCLINGTQLTAAMGVKIYQECKQMLRLANLSAAMMIEAMRASHAFLHPALMREQRHPGALACAEEVAEWIQSPTEISQSHADCDRVQDPYSIRCVPQVHGMVADELAYSHGILAHEINASTDNPMLFPEEDMVVHGGNFHAIYAARTCDRLGAAMATLASISERRIHMAMKQEKSGLPNFLIKEGGLNSGLMMAQTTAAALVSECKSLSFPASVDSISTNNDQEDHVSMGPIAGLKALQIAKNLRYVLAIELMSAAQGLDLLAPLKTSARLEAIKATIRTTCPLIEQDRVLHDDIEAVAELSRGLV